MNLGAQAVGEPVDHVPLAEAVDFAHDRPNRWPDDIPFLGMNELPDSALYADCWRLLTRPEIKSGVPVRNGDLLVAKITPCFENGKQGIVRDLPDEWGYATTEVHRLRARSHVDIGYVAYWLRRSDTRKRLADAMEGTTGRQRLPRAALEKELIGLPSLDEQRRIVRILSTIQQCRDATHAVTDAARTLIAALSTRCFADLDGVSTRLGDIADVKGGKRLPKGHPFADNTTQFPYIRIVDFLNGSVDVANLKYLSSEDHQAIQRYVIRADDVYISIAGSVGLAGTVPQVLDGANLTENAARIVIRDSTIVTNRFVYWYLASEFGQAEIRLRATRTSQPKLALGRIADIPITIPPIKQQEVVVSRLDTAQARLIANQRLVDALEVTFASTLTTLFRGCDRDPRL